MQGLQLQARHSRALAILLVAGLHALTFWALALKPFVVPNFAAHPELSVTVFNSTPQVARVEPTRVHADFKAPEAVIVPEPDIVIDDSDTPAIASKPMLQKIPPRLDLGKAHDLPNLPDQYRAWAKSASLVLRILILQDGSIGEADVARSSGQQDVDDFVCEFVRANWHYLPATVSGSPVQDWMTVVVRFAA